ncbi:MAG: PepSY-associated TM helix domain-containing protein [Pseudoalteromonas spongiae]
MNNKTLKSLTNAHAWIGLVISIVLFIVFFAGSISLFRENIVAWEKLPIHANQTVSTDSQNVSYDNAIATINKHYDVYVDHRFYLLPPTEHSPYIEAYFAKNIEGTDPETGEDHSDVHIMLDAQSGEIIGNADTMDFGNFVYQLHYNLGLGRIGLYFVGIITLFFFVAVLSGLLIHWRKLFKNFFQYRKDSNKDKWLDAHNIIGTMGLPFHVMYAFTGLVFNLVIVYQISYALVLYQGDQQKLLAAAGFNEPHIDIIDNKMTMNGIDRLREMAEKDMDNAIIDRIMIEHFGDESAVAIFTGQKQDRFATETAVHYQLSNQQQIYLTKDNYDNAVRSGLGVIARLHFGDFAGYGLRLAFFLLGLATCYVILTGNLMWLEKRAKQRNQSQRSLNFVTRMTSGGFIGFIFAIAVGFSAARIIPIEITTRAEIIENSVFASFLLMLVLAQLIKHNAKFNQYSLQLSGTIFALVVVLDWVLLPSATAQQLAEHKFDVVITQSILLLLSGISFFAAKQVTKKPVFKSTQTQPSVTELTTQ